MLNLTANEAKTNFGDALMKAQQMPVQISKYGNPVAMLVSIDDFQESDSLKMELIKLRIERAKLQIEQGDLVDGEDFFEQLLAGKSDSTKPF